MHKQSARMTFWKEIAHINCNWIRHKEFENHFWNSCDGKKTEWHGQSCYLMSVGSFFYLLKNDKSIFVIRF